MNATELFDRIERARKAINDDGRSAALTKTISRLLADIEEQRKWARAFREEFIEPLHGRIRMELTLFAADVMRMR